MNNFDNIKFKSYQKNFIFIFSVSFLYFFPLFVTGSGRLIDYTTTHFSLLILSENLFSPYTFFYDLIGPGTRLPLGSGLYNFFPTSFFIENYFLFFTSTIVFGFYLQLNFCKKLFKIFNFKNYYLLAFLLSTNITVIYHLLNGDAIKIFFTFSCLPCLLYYTLKFLNLQSKLYFYKLIFFLSFVTLNSHEGYLITSCLGFLLLVFFNRNFFFLTKTFFYFGLVIFFLINIENIYRIYSDLFNYPSSERSFIKPYDLKHYTSGIVFIFKFLEDFFKLDFPFLSPTKMWDNYYLPFGGLLFYFSFFECFRLFVKNNSKNIYYINIIFLILIFLSLLDLNNISFGVIVASYAFRDAINFFSIILFGNFLKNIKNFKIKTFIIFLVLISAILHMSSSIYLKFKEDRNNFDVIKKNDDLNNSIFSKTLENLDLKNKNFSKTYLSEGIWKKINNQDEEIFLDANIFKFVDLINYKIYPFNSEFKTASKYPLRKSLEKFYSNIHPRFKEINDNNFFNIFNIHYLIILESEIKNIEIKKFREIANIPISNDSIIFFELKDKRNVFLVNNEKLKSINCEKEESVGCLLNNKSIFEKDDQIKIERLEANKYKLKNETSTPKYFVLPFLYDQAWKPNDNLIKFKDGLMFLSVLPNDESIISYIDYERIMLKTVSIISLLLLFIFLITRKKKVN